MTGYADVSRRGAAESGEPLFALFRSRLKFIVQA